MHPEEKARAVIDDLLQQAGWAVQNYKAYNPNEGSGQALREVSTTTGPADYILILDRKAIGVIEAKREGKTLSEVENQSARYAASISADIPHDFKTLPFAYESTGVETFFTDRRDPDARSRRVFAFHKPETFREWIEQGSSLRDRLKTDLPELITEGLRDCQVEAITNLDESFRQAKPRALIQMATGSGKTFTAISFIYRLIKFSKAKRILFMVDRKNLGEQAYKEFQQFTTPDDGRKFTELYITQYQTGNQLDKDCKVCITTVQRLFSMLKGEENMDDSLEEQSSYMLDDEGPEKFVQYNSSLPIESFDFIVTDECHRSIYKLWRQVLEYFDSFLIGLTATPSAQTIGFFGKNMVMEYSHDRAVADGVNVGFNVYRIKTEITEEGSKLTRGDWIRRRERNTRKVTDEELDDKLEYGGKDLDRSVVSVDQIRTVIRTYKERLFSEIYPDRVTVPKTLIFAKDDSHAEDIVRMVREEFGKGNDFCKKITYKIKENPKEVTQQFRNSFNPRIVVTVDLISTGTDIKPLEVLIFMRDVRSKNYFEQMLGRGTRTIPPSDLQAVTGDAEEKTHFIVVDAVGVCESEKPEMKPVDRKEVKSPSFDKLLTQIAFGNIGSDKLSSLAKRLTTLSHKLDPQSLKEVEAQLGKPLSQVTDQLRSSINPKNHKQHAQENHSNPEPNGVQMAQSAEVLKQEAVKPFEDPALRELLIEKKKQADQIIDEKSLDSVLHAGFDAQAEARAKERIGTFKQFLEDKKDELTALQIFFQQPYGQRHLTFDAVRELVDAIKKPPYRLSNEELWKAYELVEKDKVKKLSSSTKALANIVSLIRHALGEAETLEPFVTTVEQRFSKWMAEQEKNGRGFTQEQKHWLGMIKEHVASSVNIEISDLENTPFKDKGGAMGAYKVFGDDLQKIMEELSGVLAA